MRDAVGNDCEIAARRECYKGLLGCAMSQHDELGSQFFVYGVLRSG